MLLFLFSFLLLFGCNQEETKAFRIGAKQGPSSMDPRSARSLTDANILHLLFEGLMRPCSGGVSPAVAKSVFISKDRLTYVFTLRESSWIDGSAVTAKDFVRSWADQIAPSTSSVNSSMFYCIKNAEKIRQGIEPIESFGAVAVDDKTLSVELKEPTPYFLHLTACYAFFPVHEDADKTNGPYFLKSYTPGRELVAEKRESYWNASRIKIETISLALVDSYTALNMFEEGTLDWTGSPYCSIPAEALPFVKHLQTAPAAATSWLRFNVQKFPLDSLSLRQALHLSIDRQEIIDATKAAHTPAFAVIPSMDTWQTQRLFSYSPKRAKEHYLRALEEIGDAPKITLSYLYDNNHHAIAQCLQQQWYRTLGLWVELQAVEEKLLAEQLTHLEYSISLGSWFADFTDPLNFLGVFAENNHLNQTGWEEERFKELLRLCSLCPHKREELLREAEAVLLEQAPIAPLFFYSLQSLKQPKVEGVTISATGIQLFDFMAN